MPDVVAERTGAHGYAADIGCFASHFTDRDLLTLIRDGACRAAPDAPTRCTQRAFDHARDRGEVSNVPTARQICTRLNARRAGRRSWRQWVELALDDSASLDRVAGRGRTDPRAGDPRPNVIAFALRLVRARVTGEAPSAVAYDAARLRLLPSLTLRLRSLLPTAAQIVQVTGSWKAALRLAGWEPRLIPGAPVVRPLRAADMIEAFVVANGAWPTKRALEEFGARADVRWRRPHQDGHDMESSRVAARERLIAAGHRVPPADRRWRSMDGQPAVDTEALGQTAPASTSWTLPPAVDAVAGWLEGRAGREVTWRAYIADAAGDPSLPKGSTITRLGGWGRIRDQARQGTALESR